MTDYSNSCIYKIVCKDQSITDFYIGSTCNFKHRRKSHKYDCKKSNYKVYEFIRSNGGWDNFDMVKIRDKLGVDNKVDLHTIEGQYLKLFKPALNKYAVNRSPAESSKAYYEKNKDKRKIYEKKNREKRNKQQRERYALKKLAQKS